jgi:glutamate-ammonia-ligase adenylyltransferase
MCASLNLIPANLSESARNAYREYRRLQHGRRLNEDSQSRILRERIAAHVETVRALWQFLFQNQKS